MRHLLAARPAEGAKQNRIGRHGVGESLVGHQAARALVFADAHVSFADADLQPSVAAQPFEHAPRLANDLRPNTVAGDKEDVRDAGAVRTHTFR